MPIRRSAGMRAHCCVRNGNCTMKSVLWYLLAAAGEIADCFAFWSWLRLGKSPLWTVSGVVSLVIFALALTRIDTAAAGRALLRTAESIFSLHLLWLWFVER